jgi:carboxymethylenebutenolidase
MCFGNRARPPQPPRQGPVGDHADLTLSSADGTRFMAYHADAAPGSTDAMVILPDVRGLHVYYKDLAIRFAEAGLHAIAIDLYGRTAGPDRSEEFEYRQHAEQIQLPAVHDDVSAALGWLAGRHHPGAVFTVGFCMGGSLSWAQSAGGHQVDGHPLAGCIGFYGRPERVEPVRAQLRVPLLLLAAGRDFTPVAEVQEFADRVTADGVPATVRVYPEAPHSFFDRTFDEYAPDCAQAWVDLLGFIDDRSGAGRHGR